jgi:sialidase-1
MAMRGAMEPEVLELKDGRLLMMLRCQMGYIAASYSTDGGETWSEAQNWGVKAPESPATLRRIPATGDLLLIWNNNYVPGADHGGKRRPLSAAVSDDEGRTWRHTWNLEGKPGENYAYTSVTFVRDRILLSYYVEDEKTQRLSSRFRSIAVRRFYEP